MNNINSVSNNLNQLFQAAENKASKNSEINKTLIAQSMIGQLSDTIDKKTESVVVELFASVLTDKSHKADRDTVKSIIKHYHPELFKKGNKDRKEVLKKINESLVDWAASINKMNLIDITGRAKAK
jgi:hypothetical protein